MSQPDRHHAINDIVTDADREMLALAYEESVPIPDPPHQEGPFIYYVVEARTRSRAFTMCSLRAIARARLAGEVQHQSALVDNLIDRLKQVSLSSVWLIEADPIHQAWIAMLPEPSRKRIHDAIAERFAVTDREEPP